MAKPTYLGEDPSRREDDGPSAAELHAREHEREERQVPDEILRKSRETFSSSKGVGWRVSSAETHLRCDDLVEGDKDGRADGPGHRELAPPPVRPSEERRESELRHEARKRRAEDRLDDGRLQVARRRRRRQRLQVNRVEVGREVVTVVEARQVVEVRVVDSLVSPAASLNRASADASVSAVYDWLAAINSSQSERRTRRSRER
jgi:hypothetical protein